ncbi:RNA 2',3'-cyclic phosphodiesterase [Candidatus Dependentiae bacterium]|nr:RNA 2',3'-cyclic phosphodiesterase [Candidatus Dependentiae bacterium]
MNANKSKRLFLAIYPTKEILDQIVKVKNQINFKNIRWISRDNLHITLCFLGKINENIIPKLIKKLILVFKDIKKFYIEFESITLAPNDIRPYMIWAKFKKNKNYEELVKKTKKICSEFISNKQNNHKEIIPHITLARGKNLIDSKFNIKQPNIPNILVHSCYLVESKLNTNGSIYKNIKLFTFK